MRNTARSSTLSWICRLLVASLLISAPGAGKLSAFAQGPKAVSRGAAASLPVALPIGVAAANAAIAALPLPAHFASNPSALGVPSAAAPAAPAASVSAQETLAAAASEMQTDHREASGGRRFDGSKSQAAIAARQLYSFGTANQPPSAPAQTGKKPVIAPVMPLTSPVFPGKETTLTVERKENVEVVQEALKSGGYMIATTIGGDNRVGTLVRVSNPRVKDGVTTVDMETLHVVKIKGYQNVNGIPHAKVSYPELAPSDADHLNQLAQIAKSLLPELASVDSEIPQYLLKAVDEPDPAALANTLADDMPFSLETQQEMLALPSTEALMERVAHEMVARFKTKSPASGKASDIDTIDTLEGLRAKMAAIGMPEPIRDVALKTFDEWSQEPKSGSGRKLRRYLQWLTDLPWSQRTEDVIDIKKAQEQLDRDHFGLERVKERVLESLAVRKKTGNKKGSILCFVGPPGVGKTSIASAIAQAMGRRFVRLSLGGKSDETTLLGHDRTYEDSLPGKIIQLMKEAGTINPVMLFDEVDKIAQRSNHGDPSAVLLEILDPEQNNTFRDSYLNVPYDLSEVLFVITANTLGSIPEPLRDRVEIIEFDGYTPLEKIGIAEGYVAPEMLREAGLKPEEAQLTPAALRRIIEGYTREAGVRSLRKKIRAIFRKVAAWIETRGEKTPGIIDENAVAKYLGKPKYRHKDITENGVGLGTGLAVNDYGGSVMNVVVRSVPGSGRLKLRRQLRKMIADSADNALIYIRSEAAKFGLSKVDFRKIDLDISYTPAGEIDGPSAGILMTTALISHLTGRQINPGIAMTGEVTADGRVLPIGGLKQKVMAAHRMGYKTVIFPAANETDVEDIPAEIRNEIILKPVKTYDEVFPLVMGEAVPGKAVAVKTAAPPLARRGTFTATLKTGVNADDPLVVVTGADGVVDRFPLSGAREVLRQASRRWWNPFTWFEIVEPKMDPEPQKKAVTAYLELLASRNRRGHR